MNSVEYQIFEDIIAEASVKLYPTHHLHFAALHAFNIGCNLWNVGGQNNATTLVGCALRLIQICPVEYVQNSEIDAISSGYSHLLKATSLRESN